MGRRVGRCLIVASLVAAGLAVTPSPARALLVTDLELTKEVSLAAAFQGETIPYTFRVHNRGHTTVSGAVLSDTLDPTVDLVSAPSSCTVADRTVTCPLAPLDPRSNAFVGLYVRLLETGTVRNEAAVSSDDYELDPSNNHVAIETVVTARADLAVTETTLTPDAISVITPMTYTATITNRGPSPATDVALDVTVPPVASALTVSASGGSCVLGEPLVCAIGSLDAGASVTVTLELKAVAPGTGDFVAHTRAAQEDATSWNNVAQRQLEVLSLIKTWWPRSDTLPGAPRSYVTVAYDHVRAQAVSFGGLSTQSDVVHDDTWLWDGSRWSAAPAAVRPPARFGAHMAYDPLREQVVLFGGEGELDLLGDTWIWDGVAWTQRAPLVSPPPRSWGGMAFDPGSGSIVLFGGMDESFEALDDSWMWDGVTWKPVGHGAKPPARFAAAMATDEATGSIVLFGGIDQSHELLGDTWIWDGSRWSARSPAVSPSPRYGAAATFDGGSGTVTIFGGETEYWMSSDLWSWTGSTWIERWAFRAGPSRVGPAPLEGAGMVYAPNTGPGEGSLLVFGGASFHGTHSDPRTYGVIFGAEVRTHLDATSVAFGSVAVGVVSSPRSVTVRNVGALTTQVTGLGISGKDAAKFALESEDCTGRALDPGDACTVRVTFSPGAAGASSATLTITDGSRSSPYQLPLSGSGHATTLKGPAAPGTSVSATLAIAGTTSAFTVSWANTAADVTTFDVEIAERSRASSGAWVQSPWRSLRSATTATSVTLKGSHGRTYIFRARARTPDGVGAWSPTIESIVPLDDRSSSLIFSSGWSKVSGSGRWYGTERYSSKAGASMTIKTYGQSFSLVATTCRSCGKVKVYLDGKYVATVDTYSSSTKTRQVVWTRNLPGGIKLHTLKIVNQATSARPQARIDAIAFRR